MCSSIIVGEVFTKALRRKDQAGSSATTRGEADVAVGDTDAPKVTTKTASTAGGDEEAALPGEGESDAKDNKVELEQIEEDMQKASSGKILNLISVDTYRRACTSFRVARDLADLDDVAQSLKFAPTCTLSRARCPSPSSWSATSSSSCSAGVLLPA